jgi:hypothetical protein
MNRRSEDHLDQGGAHVGTGPLTTQARHLLSCVLVYVLLALGGISCSDAPTGRDVDETQHALSIPGQTPVPCVVEFQNSLWDGTTVQLMTADALAACGGPALAAGYEGDLAPLFMDTTGIVDEGLNAVLSRMRETIGNPDGFPLSSHLSHWSEFRRRTRDTGVPIDFFGATVHIANCDPATGEPLVFPYDLRPTPVVETLDLSALYDVPARRSLSDDLANRDLQWAGVNLCIAQRLRQVAPGAAGGEALFMTRAEQRELLETIRERAQIAMVNYALLGMTFSAQMLTDDQAALFLLDSGVHIDVRLPWLQGWANQVADPALLAGMGQDFAAAVQLHIAVTRELAELLARSRSAREPHRPTVPPEADWGAADDTWGTGSWQQRQAALMFGGDPLAQQFGGPWQHPMGVEAPGLVAGFLEFNDRNWPTRRGLPYVRARIDEPQIAAFSRMADQANELRFNIGAAGPSQCAAIDPVSSGNDLYEHVEKALRRLACVPGEAGTAACLAFPAHDEDTLLWRHHAIARRHAVAVAELYRDLIGPRFGRPSAAGSTTCPGQPGAMSFRGTLDHPGGVTNRLWLTGAAVRRSASSPPSSRRFIHVAIVVAVTRNRRAVSAAFQPAAARSMRTASRSHGG